jgi:hypothetical protein
MSPYTTQPAISAYTGIAQKQQARMTTAQPPNAMTSMSESPNIPAEPLAHPIRD